MTTRPSSAKLSMFHQGGSMARTRKQKITAKNPSKRGPSWYFQFREYVTLTDGTEVGIVQNKRLGPCKGPGALTRKEAERIAQEEFLDKVNQSNQYPASAMTVSEFITRRFAIDVARDSVHYRNVLPHVERAIGKLQLRQVQPGHVLDLMAAMRRKGLSGATQKHVYGAIRRIFRYAKAVGAFRGDVPTEYLDPPKADSKQRGALSIEQVRGVLEILEPPYRQFALLLTVTGLRAAEALGLKWSAVNLTNAPMSHEGVYIPPRAFALLGQWTRGAWADRLKAHGRSVEVLPLPDVAADSLAEWHAASKAASGWIFDVGYGQPFEPSTACNKKLKPALRQVLGLDSNAPIEESWHWLRHTLATLADEAGMSDAQRQQILRHSTAGMTRRYTHPNWDSLVAGLNKVGRRVAGEEAKVVEFRRAN